MRILAQLAIATALLATIASTLCVCPHQLAYFNELAGGPENGHRHLLHSNLDSGQDLLFVREWMQREGLRPDEVRVVSYGVLARQKILVGASFDRSANHRREVVSPNRVFAFNSPWRERVLGGQGQRVGCVMWAFPVN